MLLCTVAACKCPAMLWLQMAAEAAEMDADQTLTTLQSALEPHNVIWVDVHGIAVLSYEHCAAAQPLKLSCMLSKHHGKLHARLHDRYHQ